MGRRRVRLGVSRLVGVLGRILPATELLYRDLSDKLLEVLDSIEPRSEDMHALHACAWIAPRLQH